MGRFKEIISYPQYESPIILKNIKQRDPSLRAVVHEDRLADTADVFLSFSRQGGDSTGSQKPLPGQLQGDMSLAMNSVFGFADLLTVSWVLSEPLDLLPLPSHASSSTPFPLTPPITIYTSPSISISSPSLHNHAQHTSMLVVFAGCIRMVD